MSERHNQYFFACRPAFGWLTTEQLAILEKQIKDNDLTRRYNDFTFHKTVTIIYYTIKEDKNEIQADINELARSVKP